MAERAPAPLYVPEPGDRAPLTHMWERHAALAPRVPPHSEWSPRFKRWLLVRMIGRTMHRWLSGQAWWEGMLVAEYRGQWKGGRWYPWATQAAEVWPVALQEAAAWREDGIDAAIAAMLD